MSKEELAEAKLALLNDVHKYLIEGIQGVCGGGGNEKADLYLSIVSQLCCSAAMTFGLQLDALEDVISLQYNRLAEIEVGR